MKTPIFTEITTRGQGFDPFGGYVDNVIVMTPEPSTALLLTLGLAGLGVRRRLS